MTELSGRPWDFTERIIEAWQQLVLPDDIVYHLGDVALYRKAVQDIIPTLPGIKHLILGNHDRAPKSFYLSAGFTTVQKILTTAVGNIPIVLSHKARLETPVGWLNICGHSHNKVWWTDSWPQIQVISLETQGYAPQKLEDIVRRQKCGLP